MQNINKNKTYGIITLGCKVNQYESYFISTILEDMGYQYKEWPGVCDVYVVNTCTVTNMSDRKSRQMIHKVKKINPNCVVIATGCLAQNKPENMRDNGADIVIGNTEKTFFKELVEEALKSNELPYENVSNIAKQKEYSYNSYAESYERTRAYIKIQDGCNNFCSYCIIPYVRGRSRSRDISDIIKEAEHMADKGLKEIVITGINLNDYGKDLQDISLSDVILALNEIKGIRRIRLGSLEPNIITEEFLYKIAGAAKLCPHFHLSLQSGSNKVLADMNRNYNREDFLRACTLLREQYSDCEITADIIVGYPTETEEDFLQSMDIVNRAAFLQAHIFKYSRRVGTKATNLKLLDSAVVKDRSERLIKEASISSFNQLSKNMDKTVEILVEQQINDKLIGHTRNYTKVTAKLKSNKSQDTSNSGIINYENSFVKVKIDEVLQDGLSGIVV